MRRMRVAPFAILILAALAGGGPASAQEPAYAPVDAPGPALGVPADVLDAAISCPVPPDGADRNPLLLVPGTNLEPEANFGWNHIRFLTAEGWPHCTVELPEYALADIQVAAEYVVHAVRSLAERSGRQVDVLGYSQGGMVPRWALRWWPDVRPLVGDLVGLAPSNHGTVLADGTCQDSCDPAHWQQASQARFIEALNSHTETFAGIDYTVIYTRFDEIVVPNLDESGSSSLRTGDGTIVNVALQDVCPANTADHLAIGSYDAVAHALAVDALTNDGPADPARIDLAVCARPFQPGVDPSTFAADHAAMLRVIGESGGAVENVPEEPPLACYVTASCAGAAAPGAAGPSPAPAPGGSLPATGGEAAPLVVLVALATARLLRRVVATSA